MPVGTGRVYCLWEGFLRLINVLVLDVAIVFNIVNADVMMVLIVVIVVVMLLTKDVIVVIFVDIVVIWVVVIRRWFSWWVALIVKTYRVLLN